jgi:hypothetical protein
MNNRKALTLVSMAGILLFFVLNSHSCYAETIGFFGLSSKENSKNLISLLDPILPKGLGDVQFGESRDIILEKRKNVDSKQDISSRDALLSEKFPERKIYGE